MSERPAPSLWTRGVNLFAGRRRHEPQRTTEQYARLLQIGGFDRNRKSKPVIKPTPANLRYFSRTPYASRAIAQYTRPLSQLDWHFQPIDDTKETPEIKRQIEVAQACWNQPNYQDSGKTLLQQTVEDICICGQGVIEQKVGGDPQRPLWLWPVDALSIQNYVWDGDESKPRFIQTFGFAGLSITQGRDLYNRDLIYMRDRPTTDSPYAFGMLEVAFMTVNRLLGAADYAGNVAANAHPQNLIFLKGASEPELQAMRAFWRNEVEGQGLVPFVGGNDVAVMALRGNDDKALYLQYQEFIVREIANAFYLSPQNLAVERDVNRSQGEVAEDRDWDIALKPMARLIADNVNHSAIHGLLGFSQIELTPGGLDREDEKTTAEIYKLEYENNAILPNEYRARRDLPPLKSKFGEMTYAEVQIAISAARGAAAVNQKIVKEE